MINRQGSALWIQLGEWCYFTSQATIKLLSYNIYIYIYIAISVISHQYIYIYTSLNTINVIPLNVPCKNRFTISQQPMPQIIRITAGRWSQARRSVSSISRRLESQRETSISGRQIMELRLCLLWWRAVLLDILLLGRWIDCFCWSGGCHPSLFVGVHGFFKGVHLFLDCIYRWLSSMFGCVNVVHRCCAADCWEALEGCWWQIWHLNLVS